IKDEKEFQSFQRKDLSQLSNFIHFALQYFYQCTQADYNDTAVEEIINSIRACIQRLSDCDDLVKMKDLPSPNELIKETIGALTNAISRLNKLLDTNPIAANEGYLYLALRDFPNLQDAKQNNNRPAKIWSAVQYSPKTKTITLKISPFYFSAFTAAL